MKRETGQLQGLRILIVEDDEDVARILVDLIDLYGGMVAGSTASAAEASGIVNATTVDGAILDIRLGHQTCFSLAEELMRQSISVVLITGYLPGPVPDTCSHLPVFTKPFNLSALVECLAKGCQANSIGFREPEPS